MKISAGILLFKREKDDIFYFLVHPGGPFWINKNIGSWSVPKGEASEGEDLLQRAKTEFSEETGKTIDGHFTELDPIAQKGGKKVFAWALEQDIDTSDMESNLITIDWPPRSGRKIQIPEVDRWAWFSSDEAKEKINPAQAEFIIQLENILASDSR